jgi:protein-glutamine gamma-glutamyltransferase
MPRLDFWRRLFHHTALGLASACLLYAEAFFLPGALLVILYLLAGVQILAFAAEGRRWVLPSWAANLLAGAVAGGGVAWIAAELNRPDSVLASLPLPAGLLPYIGPILIGLLVVKLFRPHTPRDFWLLQGVGALQVALACVLAANPESGLLFGALLAAYLAFALGRLALHYFEEEQRLIISPQPPGRTDFAADRMPFAYLMWPFCLRWSLAVVALAAPLFLLTPRIQGPPWDSSVMASSTQRVGVVGDRAGFSEQIDLNRDGPVRLSDEEVFRAAVEAEPDQPLYTLPADQHWRGSVLDAYDRGRWTNQETKRQSDTSGRTSPPAPPLGPGIHRLHFMVGPGAGGFFLAEPVLVSREPAPSTSVDAPNSIRLAVSTRGPVLPRMYDGRREYRYRQTINAAADADQTPANDSPLYIADLRSQEVPQLVQWTSALLARLAAKPAYNLSPKDIQLDVKFFDTIASAPPESHEHIGRALTAYLARSGEYGYTLDLRRQDTSLDPVMDFLVNTKQGHCERFASALALMLRSQGIPSRIVVGFRGAADPVNGVTIIRRNQAHAWVEMLVPRHSPEGPSSAEWITLDPTPAAEPTAPIPYSFWEWWRDGQRAGQELWGGLVVNYNAEEQADLWTRMSSPVGMTALTAIGPVFLLFTALAGLAWLGLRWRRRADPRGAPRPAPIPAGYARLLALLARYGRLQPKIGQTPREFAGVGRRFLLALPAAYSFADLPDEIVDRLYRLRFGGQSPDLEDDVTIARRLNQLAGALRGGS